MIILWRSFIPSLTWVWFRRPPLAAIRRETLDGLDKLCSRGPASDRRRFQGDENDCPCIYALSTYWYSTRGRMREKGDLVTFSLRFKSWRMRQSLLEWQAEFEKATIAVDCGSRIECDGRIMRGVIDMFWQNVRVYISVCVWEVLVYLYRYTYVGVWVCVSGCVWDVRAYVCVHSIFFCSLWLISSALSHDH